MRSVFILTLICMSFAPHPQSNCGYEQGFRYIDKAEKIVNSSGDYELAIKYLNKAKKCSYGFCGNAWLDAFSKINRLSALAHYKLEDYPRCLANLDSMEDGGWGYNYAYIDSLKVESLIKVHGWEQVRQDFNAVMDNTFMFTYDSAHLWTGELAIPLASCNYTFRISTLTDGESTPFELRYFLKSRNYWHLISDEE